VTRALPPLKLGPIAVDPPVILAPMAGVTNVAFRRLCRTYGAGLYVSEMVTARALVEGNAKTMGMLTFGDDEPVRSVQLYGVDPGVIKEAVRRLVDDIGVDHIDLNFGCPAAKVTRRGGGAALPVHRTLLRHIIAATVKGAGSVPVTTKFRVGVDDTHTTYLETGRIAEGEGAVAVALHARTAEQLYSGNADWQAIAALKEAITTIPVLGNGDIWEAADAIRMVRETGAAGVVVGRGCLGRPWLFRDLAAAFAGQEVATLPALGEVASMMRRHAELLCFHMGEERGCKEFRKHISWYLKGFRAGGELRKNLGLVSSLGILDRLLVELDPVEPFPVQELGTPRGRQGSPRHVVLPEGWLEDTDGTDYLLREDTSELSGG